MKKLILYSVIAAAGCAPEELATGHTSQAVTGADNVQKLAYGGFLDTDVSFTEFFGQTFTMMGWVMPEFVYNNPGPLFASNNGTFFFGQEDFRRGEGGGSQVFLVRVGNRQAKYSVPGYEKRRWNHVALVRGVATIGQTVFRFYLNGERQVAFSATGPGDDVMFDPGETVPMPPGAVRIGRVRATKPDVSQLYALLDDLQIYRHSLTQVQVTAASGRQPSGTESNLLAAWTFEPAVTPRPPTLNRPLTLNQPTMRVIARGPLAADGGSGDEALFDDPSLALMGVTGSAILPFDAGTIWRVTQGNDNPDSSHNGGIAAFCWDFANVAAPAGSLIRISASGMMSRVFLDPGPAPAGQNEGSNVDVTVMPDFINKYLHLAYGSFDTVFNGGTPLLFWPTPSEQWTWISVSQGRALGVTGPNARHLHFDTHDSAGTTVPNVFRSYFESNDDGTTWTFITAGRPREGSLVKR